MDSIKIHDSRLPHRNDKSFHGFLDRKLKSRSADSISSVYTTDLETSDEKPDRVTPNYSFEFQSFSIGQHVEYNVVLVEKYKILGRTMFNKYQFKTRYSMLEVLNQKLGGLEFPCKKIFGNKNPSFVEKRKVELERYLNKVARAKKPEFLKFVKQIKDSDFNMSLNKSFSIE